MKELIDRCLSVASEERVFFRELSAFSMLDDTALALLNLFARESKGAILEIGPYMGASTIAVATATGSRKFITIEAGGSREDHPTIPTSDILGDLRENLGKYGVADRVTIIPKYAHKAYVGLAELLASDRIGLVFIDADGNVSFHLGRLKPFLAPDCLIVLDDYLYAPKAEHFKAWLDGAVEEGVFNFFGVFGNGTWFGQLNGQYGLDMLRETPCFPKETGHCYWAAVDTPWPIDKMGQNISELRLFENGKELGPPHSKHKDIREIGRGRFSHWVQWLYFSTSDNSDPNTNGRKYVVRCEDEIVEL